MKNIRLYRQDDGKYPARQNESCSPVLYNHTRMCEEMISVKENFAKRLTDLRNAKDVSAREMSLALGQGAGYINNIENGNNLPSMNMFFEICEYLGVMPEEFFDYRTSKAKDNIKLEKLISELDYEEQLIIRKLVQKLAEKQ